MTDVIDLNSDLAEWTGAAPPHEFELLAAISSANIACGGHAGGLEAMRWAVEHCLRLGVAVGAHPGYPDRAQTGRAELGWPLDRILTLLEDQVEALDRVARELGARVRHVKAHGALYHRLAYDPEAAAGFVAWFGRRYPDLWLFVPPGSPLAEQSSVAGLAIRREGFLDRAYRPDGRLVPRSEPGAMIADRDAVGERAILMARDGRVPVAGGGWCRLPVDTLCIHGDTPNAHRLAERARLRLAAVGIRVAAPAPRHATGFSGGETEKLET